MQLIDRYLLSIFGRLFGLCLGTFTVIYLVIDFLEKFNRFNRAGGSTLNILRFFAWQIPDIVSQTAPLAVLMATVLTLGTLTRTSELVAMQSAGISLARLTAPLLGGSIGISLLLLASGELLLPAATEQMNYTEQVLIARKPPSAAFRQDNIWYRDDEKLLRARKFDPDKQTLSDVTIWRITPTFVPQQRIDATSGQLSANGWTLYDVSTRELLDGGASAAVHNATVQIPLDLRPDDLKNLHKYADNLSFSHLRRYVAKLKDAGYDASRYETLMHAHLAQSFAPLVMGTLGIPFALRSNRSSGIAKGVGLSMALGFAYFVTNAICVALGQSTVIPPEVGGWSANVLFLALGCWLTISRQR